MANLKMIDVTLRDGGHLNSFRFTDEAIYTILTALDASGIDYIEIGYRNGFIRPIENIGITGLCPNDYILRSKELIKKSKIAIMAHCKNINRNDIEELK